MPEAAYRVEELKESGGSYLMVAYGPGFVDANVGTPEYVSSHSFMYENPGLRAHVASIISPQTTIAYINHIVVYPTFRRRGIGKGLMKRMLRELKARGAVHVYGHMAESSGQTKERLGRWLGRFGFEEVDCCEEDSLPVVALTL